MQGHVPHVDVIFNGKVTRSLVLDSGASVIALTADLAKALEQKKKSLAMTKQRKGKRPVTAKRA
jgi:predicted aspartyl protease